MTVVSKDIDDMVALVANRYLALGRLLEECAEVGAAFEPTEDWLRRFTDRNVEIHALARAGNEDARRQQLKCFVIHCCITEVVIWCSCQRVAGDPALKEARRVSSSFWANLGPKERAKLMPVEQKLRSFNPLGMGRRTFNLWLARQDEMLRDIGLPLARLRALRGEGINESAIARADATRRASQLRSRTRQKRDATLVTDSLLNTEQRALRDAARKLLSKQHSSCLPSES